ncbi:bile acid:sodium symporter [Shigella flexneri]
MHGAKLSREAIIAGGGHWRLHLWVMCSTLVLFPILGRAVCLVENGKCGPMLYSVLSTCTFSPRPCSVQSPSRK